MTVRQLLLTAGLAALSAAATVDRHVFETDDAVVIQAAGLEETSRAGRELAGEFQRSQTVVPPGWPGLPAGVTDTCSTPDGRTGQCVTRSVCHWFRTAPDDASVERSLGFCAIPDRGRAGPAARRPLTRGVCCPGLFGSLTTTTAGTTAAPAVTNWWQTTATGSTARPSTDPPATTDRWWITTTGTSTRAPPTVTHWWQTTAGDTASSASPTVTHWWQTTAGSTEKTDTSGSTSTPQRPTAPSIPPIITHPWQASSTTPRPGSVTAWWQASGATPAATTAAPASTTTSTSAATGTSWWQTTERMTVSTSSSTTEAAAAEISDKFSACGTRAQDANRIVGGREAVPGEFPWIAGIFKSGRQFCGGSLIDEKHILTAAHCVAHMTSYDVRQLSVRLGEHDISKTDEKAAHEEFKVSRVIRHRGFTDQKLHTDIALLTLAKPVQFKDHIRPVCLAESSERYTGENVTVAGWGTLSEAGRQPDVLQKVMLKVWDNADCARSYGSSAPGGIISSMLCASSFGKDSCSGDSGGPLMLIKANQPVYQVGVVSWGIGCAKPEYPGVYTRVTSLLEWIERNRQAY